MAGVIGAKGNNGKGIAGVCWNVKLVSLKVINNNGQGYSSYAYRAISDATIKNIPILNLSFCWSEDEAGGRYNQVLDTMIASYPGLVVCCAGNDNNNNDSYGYYPSNCRLSNLISVGASTQNNGRWVSTATDGSNYGSWSVDMFAPGDNIQTTSTSFYTYDTLDGTSLAAPFVAGIAALILSSHPSILDAEDPGALLKNIIMDSVDTFSAFSGKCVTGGRVNAYKAVTSDLAHTYIARRYTYAKHKRECECGDYYYENHTWNAAETMCIECGTPLPA